MEGIRREVALGAVEILRDPARKQGELFLSRGMDEARTYCAVEAIAALAVAENIIPAPLYIADQNAWAYGPKATGKTGYPGSLYSLCLEIQEWATCGPMGPDLAIPGYDRPISMVYASDIGVPFEVIADALSIRVSG